MTDSSTRKRLVVMVSGSGTNLQAIMDAIHDGEINAEIALVISNRRAAFGLVRAQSAGIPTLYFPLKAYKDAGKSREEYDHDLAGLVTEHRPDLIVLAGWMHVFDARFLNHFPNQVINLHPALPGTFPGTDAIPKAFEAYRRGEITHSGCMVHYVSPEVDAGPVIGQTTVAIQPEDDLPTFETRLHEAEHRLIVESIKLALQAT
ncbi:MAG: phosphoribosylglycinamide formyltransferase [Chloroflexi bacterium]|nr:phosphoribosylglycinamide formyltransferase [Chloroflexota bacterium]MCL5273835.1 phosphoribosylglycinamide formyltransferase [Chloroflexota bacterium]